MDSEHMRLWSSLYSELSVDEANAFSSSLSQDQFEPNTPIFRDGDTDRRLYLLDKGLLRLSFRDGNRDLSFGTVSPGTIVGAENFFARTLERTFSATPLTPVTVKALRASVIDTWRREGSNLPLVLYHFCFRDNPIPELLSEHNLDRRNGTRVRMRGRLAARVLDGGAHPVGRPFSAELRDLSSGGVRFSSLSRKEATAEALLGRRVALKSAIRTGDSGRELRKAGRIVAVQSRPGNEYTFHVRFDKPVPHQLVTGLESAAHPGGNPDPEPET
jgi:CRP-like cAMP-binding protein